MIPFYVPNYEKSFNDEVKVHWGRVSFIDRFYVCGGYEMNCRKWNRFSGEMIQGSDCRNRKYEPNWCQVISNQIKFMAAVSLFWTKANSFVGNDEYCSLIELDLKVVNGN